MQRMIGITEIDSSPGPLFCFSLCLYLAHPLSSQKARSAWMGWMIEREAAS